MSGGLVAVIAASTAWFMLGVVAGRLFEAWKVRGAQRRLWAERRARLQDSAVRRPR